MQKSRTGSLNYVGNKQQMLLDIKESLKHLHVNSDQTVTRPSTNALSNLVDSAPVVAPSVLPPPQTALSRRSGAARFLNHQKQLDEISKSLAPHKDVPNGLGDSSYNDAQVRTTFEKSKVSHFCEAIHTSRYISLYACIPVCPYWLDASILWVRNILSIKVIR